MVLYTQIAKKLTPSILHSHMPFFSFFFFFLRSTAGDRTETPPNRVRGERSGTHLFYLYNAYLQGRSRHVDGVALYKFYHGPLHPNCKKAHTKYLTFTHAFFFGFFFFLRSTAGDRTETPPNRVRGERSGTHLFYLYNAYLQGRSRHVDGVALYKFYHGPLHPNCKKAHTKYLTFTHAFFFGFFFFLRSTAGDRTETPPNRVRGERSGTHLFYLYKAYLQGRSRHVDGVALYKFYHGPLHPNCKKAHTKYLTFTHYFFFVFFFFLRSTAGDRTETPPNRVRGERSGTHLFYLYKAYLQGRSRHVDGVALYKFYHGPLHPNCKKAHTKYLTFTHAFFFGFFFFLRSTAGDRTETPPNRVRGERSGTHLFYLYNAYLQGRSRHVDGVALYKFYHGPLHPNCKKAHTKYFTFTHAFFFAFFSF